MLRLRHTRHLLGELTRFAVRNRMWWLLLLLPALLLAVLLTVTTHAAVPYSVYTLF